MLTREIHIGLVALSPDLRLNSHISTFALFPLFHFLWKKHFSFPIDQIFLYVPI
jgi:hypothetical protein